MLFHLKGDNKGRPKPVDAVEWASISSFCRITVAVVLLGSLVVSGVGWFTGTPGFPKHPWSGLWFMFRQGNPHVGPASMFIKREDGSREELDMSQWFRFKLFGDMTRFDGVVWTGQMLTRMGEFVAAKMNAAGQLEGDVAGFEIVRQWWAVLPDGQVKEGSIQEAVYTIDFHD